MLEKLETKLRQGGLIGGVNSNSIAGSNGFPLLLLNGIEILDPS